MQKKFAQKLMELSDIFIPYKVYPVSKYVPHSALRCFQQLYPEDYYSSQIESFLKVHTYEPAQRGADLPWWGSKYFTDTQGYRVVIVSQDSNEKDAGSVVFFACLYSPIPSEEEYKKFNQCLGKKKVFRYNSSWKKIYNKLIEWNCLINNFIFLQPNFNNNIKYYNYGKHISSINDLIRGNENGRQVWCT